MQSSSLLPASSVRSFRVHAPRSGPPLTLVAAVVLLLLGGLAGALALDWTNQPWIAGVVNGVRERTGWRGLSEAEEAFDGPIAMPVRVPLDPVLLTESAPIAVAEVPAAPARVESDGGPLRTAAAAVGEPAAPSASSAAPTGMDVGSGGATVASATGGDAAAVVAGSGAGAPAATRTATVTNTTATGAGAALATAAPAGDGTPTVGQTATTEASAASAGGAPAPTHGGEAVPPPASASAAASPSDGQ
jgi:hypothetical protein